MFLGWIFWGIVTSTNLINRDKNTESRLIDEELKQELSCYNKIIECNKEKALSYKKDTSQKFAILSVPASGAYFLQKLIFQLTGKTCEESIDAEFPMHYLDFSNVYRAYFEEVPNTKLVCLIRDLRDVFVSYAMDHGMGDTLDEKLLWTIVQGVPYRGNENRFIKDQVLEALRWMQDPNVLVLRYEDLIDPKKEEIDMRLITLNQFEGFFEVEWTSSEKEELIKKHWGKVETAHSKRGFPNGKIGSWKNYFKEAHIREFKKRYASYLIALGYESDNNW